MSCLIFSDMLDSAAVPWREISIEPLHPLAARGPVGEPSHAESQGRTSSETADGDASSIDRLSGSHFDARQSSSAAVPGVRGVSHPPHSRASILAAGDVTDLPATQHGHVAGGSLSTNR